MSSSAQSSAADTAANAQMQATDAQMQSTAAQIAESRRQYDQIQQLLSPYTNAGPGALFQQQSLIGLNGADAQQQSINGIANSPQMASMTQQGENAILQNASATGGLRGGNTQGALAQFRPQLLNSLIDQQYQRLGGLTTLGQNSAAGVGNAGQTSSGQVINALGQQGAIQGQQGAIQAGAAMAQGQAGATLGNGIASAGGLLGSYLSRPSTPGTIGPAGSTAALPSGYTGSGSTFGGESFTGPNSVFSNGGWGAY